LNLQSAVSINAISFPKIILMTSLPEQMFTKAKPTFHQAYHLSLNPPYPDFVSSFLWLLWKSSLITSSHDCLAPYVWVHAIPPTPHTHIHIHTHTHTHTHTKPGFFFFFCPFRKLVNFNNFLKYTLLKSIHGQSYLTANATCPKCDLPNFLSVLACF
jgi:hypothetical protein